VLAHRKFQGQVIGMRLRWLVALLLLLLGATALLGTLYGSMIRSSQLTSADRSVQRQQRRPLVMAHRGGAGLWPENTMHAFSRAVEMGVDVLEMDMHSTKDGVLVIIHDSTVDRTTNGSGHVNELTLEELKALDAGYRWSPDGGRSFPLRGHGLTVPTLQEAFKAFPRMRFNIDIKQEQPSLVRPFCRMIRESGMKDNLMVASFKPEVLDEFRAQCSEVATSASAADVRAFLDLKAAKPGVAPVAIAQALQIPEYAGGRQVLTRELVEVAHRHKVEVHAWTINDEASMRRMLELGVDGIITDYPDRLIALLGSEKSKD
jgi:glycerophosphoryl diester phosphodiesterase